MAVATEKDAYSDIYEHVSQSPPEFDLNHLWPDPKYLVCRVLPRDTKTRGGLELPDISQQDKDYAVVLKLDEDYGRRLHIEVSDVVWFRMVAPPKMILSDGTEIILLRCCGDDGDDVLGVFKKDS